MRRPYVAFALSGLAMGACANVWGFRDLAGTDASVEDGSGSGSGSGSESGSGGGSGSGSGSGSSSGGTDAATEAGDATADAEGGATIYNDMTQASFWSAFDLANVGVSSTGAGFHGAAFDGRYVYFLPWATGVVARYDTQGSFTALSSWATYSANSSDSGASGFFGATFDGRYLYLVPNVNGGVTRYDTQGSFTAASSWSIFDATSVNSGANGFIGAVFDGRYVFFVPNYNGVGDGIVTRYDTSSTFEASSSWTTFDTTTVDANAKTFYGGTFDGRYVYLVPDNANASGPAAVVARYDTQASFTAGASWATFDVMSVQAAANSFGGAVFDGRYVYLGASGPNGVAARYDTTGSFSAPGSWATFATLGGRCCAGFDGRYVYLTPYGTAVARYDPQASFTASAAWSSFDVVSLDAGVGSGFMGAAFDGRYVYLAPYFTSVVVRFDAKTPPSIPQLPGWTGSFL